MRLEKNFTSRKSFSYIRVELIRSIWYDSWDFWETFWNEYSLLFQQILYIIPAKFCLIKNNFSLTIFLRIFRFAHFVPHEIDSHKIISHKIHFWKWLKSQLESKPLLLMQTVQEKTKCLTDLEFFLGMINVSFLMVSLEKSKSN